MAKTLLDGVNQVLERAGVVKSSGLLTEISDASKQPSIDLAIQVINEGIDDLYSMPGVPSRPNQMAESFITLATNIVAYSLPIDLVALHFPLQDRTNGLFIQGYPGGYLQMIEDQLVPTNFTGLAFNAVIRPTDGKLYLDRTPTSADNGKVYTFGYDKDTGMSSKTDSVPFNDATFRAMVPVWTQLWKRDKRQDFDAALYKKNLARACGFLNRTAPRDSYRRTSSGTTSYSPD